MKYKLLILISLLVLLTGCTAEMNVRISGNVISEEIVIDTYPSADLSKNQLKGAFRHYVPAFNSTIITDDEPDKYINGIQFYKYNMVENNNGYRTTYTYKFNMNDYFDSRVLNEAYPKKEISNNPNEFVIKTSDSNQYLFLYPELEKLVVNVITSYKVVESNADKCIDNTCSWVITKSSNKGIYLKLDKGIVINPNVSNGNSSNDDPNDEKNGNNGSKKNNGTTNNNSDEDDIEDDEEDIEEEEENKYIWVIILVAIICFIFFVIIINKKDENKL